MHAACFASLSEMSPHVTLVLALEVQRLGERQASGVKKGQFWSTLHGEGGARVGLGRSFFRRSSKEEEHEDVESEDDKEDDDDEDVPVHAECACVFVCA